jgi:hypothetical protein
MVLFCGLLKRRTYRPDRRSDSGDSMPGVDYTPKNEHPAHKRQGQD